MRVKPLSEQIRLDLRKLHLLSFDFKAVPLQFTGFPAQLFFHLDLHFQASLFSFQLTPLESNLLFLPSLILILHCRDTRYTTSHWVGPWQFTASLLMTNAPSRIFPVAGFGTVIDEIELS